MQVVDANGNMYGDDNLEINDVNGKPKTTGGGGATPLGYYGAFQDLTDQYAAVINTGYPMLLGVTDLTNGVTVVSGSRVTIANTGIYNIQWSGQFRNPTANIHDVTVWLRKNGVDVPGSSGVVAVTAKHGSFDGHVLPSWNFLLDVVAGDYYEFTWSTEDISVYLSFQPAGSPPPSTASVVLTVTQQSGIMAGTGITALNSLTGAAQTFGNDTNVTMVSSGTNHAITWAGTLADSRIASASTWNAKQDALVSGTNIKTVNSNSLLGSGNIAITASTAWGGITGTLSSQTDLQTALDTKPTNKLAVGTNVTGTTALTISASALLPANTLVVGNPCMIHLKARGLRIGVSALGVITFGMYRNTSVSTTGATFIGSNTITAGVKMIQFERHLFWDGVSKIGAVPGATLNSDMLNTLSYTETTINPAVNNYFIYSVTLANAGDTGQIQWGLHILYI